MHPYGLKISTVGIATAALLLFCTSCYLFPKEEKILSPPLVEAQEIDYEVVELEKTTIEKLITGTGTIVSVVQVDHYFRHRGGRLENVFVRTGDTVEKGTLLAILDTDNLRNDIEQQKLMVQKAEINHERILRQTEDTSTLDLAALDLESAQLTLEELEAESAEAQRVLEVDGSTAAQTRARELDGALRHQRITVRKAELQHEKLAENRTDRSAVVSAALDIDLALLRLRSLEKELEQSRLTASVGGQVVYVNTQINEGDFIDAYRTMATIADPLQLQVQYSGRSSEDFLLGREVEVKIDDEIYRGTVVMTPANLPFDADDSLRDKIRIAVEHLAPDVKIGFSANIRFVSERKEDVLVLPRRLVMRYGTRRYVRVLENGLKEERDVQIGIETATDVEIVKGLQAGDLVIVR